MEKKTNKKKKNNVKTKIKKVKDIVLDNDANDNSFSIVEVVIIVLISILFGVVVGYLINYSKTDTTNDSNLSEIVNTYKDITNTYYKSTDKSKLSNAAIKGMIESLDDPHSNYLNSEATEEFNESIDGSFVGIGVVIQQKDDYNEIIEVYEGSPAEKAGLKVGDSFIKVDGKNVNGLNGTELAKLIKGKQGTKVNLTIKRGSKEKSFDAIRNVIEIKSVTNKILDDNIGYIRIDNFSATTYSQFYKQLNLLENKGVKSLIVDVRSNPGGHLIQTKRILSLFFNSKTVLYQTELKGKKTKVYSYSNEKRKYPIVVLIDSASASASEILASCFKDNYKDATIIGNTTYGKGTVQKTKTLSNGTTIKYTIEKWLTANGKSIDGKGVKPDVEVNLTDDYVNNPCDETDSQLQEAIKVLKESI